MSRKLWVPALLLLLGFAANFRSLQIGYLSDDWGIVNYVHRHGVGPQWTGAWLGLEDTIVMHRPVSIGLYAVELEIFGVSPRAAHLHHLLWHLAAVLLIYVATLQLGGCRRGAFLAGLLFSFHPYLPAATGWLAGRAAVGSGTLTLLTLVAFIRFHRQGSRIAYAVALVGAATAALCRETGYLALILPLTFDLLRARPRPRLGSLPWRHLPFAVVGVLLLALRYAALGTIAGGYAAGSGGLGGDAPVSTILATFGEALLRLLGGVPPEFVGGFWVIPIVAGVLTGGLLIWGRGRRPEAARGSALFLVAAFVTYALVVLVSGPTLAASTGQRWYGAIAWLCILLGLALSFLPARARWVAVLLIPVYFVGHWRVQDVLLDSDRLAKQMVAAVEGELENLPESCDAIFVSGFPPAPAGLPCVQWGFGDALRPPFRSESPAIPIYAVKSFMELGIEEAPSWPLHPPVELFLYARGDRPVALRFEEGPDGVCLVRSDLGIVPRADAEAFVRRLFHPDPLVVLRPTDTRSVLRGRPLDLGITVDATGLERLELFCFHPAVDMRYPVTVAPDTTALSVDLGPPLADFVLFHDETTTLHVIPVGFRGSEAPRLGPLLSFVILP